MEYVTVYLSASSTAPQDTVTGDDSAVVITPSGVPGAVEERERRNGESGLQWNPSV
jgi:hypothetical protein